MNLTQAERDRRWAAAVELMRRRDVDALVCYSNLGDIPAEQRYFSGYRSQFDDVAVLLFPDGSCELVVAHAGVRGLAKALSWVSEPVTASPVKPWLVGGAVGTETAGASSIGGEIANQVLRRKGRRIGVAGLAGLPSGWKETIAAAVPGVSFVDLVDDVRHLRMVKSPEELRLVREACRIADEAWLHVPEVLAVGRRRYEVLADLEHILRLNGCEDSYNLLIHLPFLQQPLDHNPYSALRIQPGDLYTLEISPRFRGYYGQQTGLVSVGGPPPREMRDAFDAVVRARDAGLAVMKAGVDMLEVTRAVEAEMKRLDHQLASPLTGHFVGLELEELRAGGASMVLEAGMTYIFHPFAAGHPAVMRADTYLITDTGVERLTSGRMAPLAL